MSNTTDLLKRAQQCVPRQSLNQLAKELGADRANLTRYMRGEGYPNAMHAIELARLLKMDVQEVIGLIAADKARTPEAANRARMKVPRIPPAAAIALALIAGLSGTDVRAAMALDFTDNSIVSAMHYAKQRRRLLRTILNFTRGFLPRCAATACARLGAPLPRSAPTRRRGLRRLSRIFPATSPFARLTTPQIVYG